jgi:hypothetical protein
MKLHQKGFLLVHLNHAESLWDQEIIAATLKEYALEGTYWENHIRVSLDELAAGGLITRLEERLIHENDKSILNFRYQVSPFGKTRIVDAGLED